MNYSSSKGTYFAYDVEFKVENSTKWQKCKRNFTVFDDTEKGIPAEKLNQGFNYQVNLLSYAQAMAIAWIAKAHFDHESVCAEIRVVPLKVEFQISIDTICDKQLILETEPEYDRPS